MKKLALLALLAMGGCSEPVYSEGAKLTPQRFYETIASDGSRGYRLIIVTNPQTKKRYLVLSNVGMNDLVSMTKLADLEPE